MGSTRLPGKVLRNISGRPMLSYQMERLKRVALCQRVVVATTTQNNDDAIVAFCDSEGVECIRGSEEDVLSRYSKAARRYDASTIVRLTADCPLIDPELVDQAIRTFFETQGTDYLSNMMEPTWPYGMAVEVMTAKSLFEADGEATDKSEREHVTPFIYWRPSRYRLFSLQMAPSLSHHRWTVDTPEDFELVSRILGSLYARKPMFTMKDVLALLEENTDWHLINSLVKQTKVTSAGDSDGI
jgi:spore coat polysaccharide biosynthesis protein SpsF